MGLLDVGDAALKQKQLRSSKKMIKQVRYVESSRVSGLNRIIGNNCTDFSGFIDGDLTNINPAYRVVIVAKLGGGVERQCITSILQEDTTLRITSDWEPFIPTGVSSAVQSVFQGLGALAGKQVSLVNRFTTRRIWRGTSPIELTMNLKFESISDTFKNVVKPTMQLMQIASPSLEGKIGLFGLLTPPGPNAFRRTSSLIDESVKTDIQAGDVISIHIGTFLKFDSVIIKEVVPVFDNRLSPDGYPISSKVAVVFQTYEVLTKSDIKDKLFQQKPTKEIN